MDQTIITTSEYNNNFMDIEYRPQEIFANMLPYLSIPGPFIDSPIDHQFPEIYFGMSFPILVIGAGGLGCQILKNLALTGFTEIHVIDMDTIDLTNLNRQFLFRHADISKFKAEVAAKFVMARVPNVKIIPHTCRIQEKPKSFYQQFGIIIAGLDNVQARRWLNQIVHSMCEFDEDGNVKPQSKHVLIDGGTQKFNGQCMVIKPYQTSCYQCMMGTLPKQQVFNSCTIAKTPRIPQHCIQYAFQILWEQAFGQKKVDNDNPEHVKWIYQKALERAESFGIKGVTYMLTLGVIKNIIPAIASTNAMIAAISTSEAFKLATNTNPSLDNIHYYKGSTMIGGETYKMEKSGNCSVCSKKPTTISFSLTNTLQQLLNVLSVAPFEIKNPSILAGQSFLVNSIMEHLSQNLSKTFDQLISEDKFNKNSVLYITYVNSFGITCQSILKINWA